MGSTVRVAEAGCARARSARGGGGALYSMSHVISMRRMMYIILKYSTSSSFVVYVSVGKEEKL